jgi:heptosyltransferase-2
MNQAVMPQSHKITQVLSIRLSAFGDVVLTRSFLDALPESVVVDYVTLQPYVDLIQDHPRVRDVIVFDKKTGFMGWLALIHQLSLRDYDAWVDLHQSLRTKIAKLYTCFKKKHWISFPKQRWALLGFFIFKNLWPKTFRPDPVTVRYQRLASQLLHCCLIETTSSWAADDVALSSSSEKWVGIMPSSKWKGKEWRDSAWLEVIQSFDAHIPIIFGLKSDTASVQLTQVLTQNGIRFINHVGQASLDQTKAAIKKCDVFLSVDTGLAHLSESLGVPVVMIFGPTHPDMGFAPRLKHSQVVQSSLWCRPCSKDGTTCFRKSYLCMDQLDASLVIQSLREVLTGVD